MDIITETTLPVNPADNPPDYKTLRTLIEQPVTRSLWGSDTTFTPELCAETFGDSRQLLRFGDILYRPVYCVVRVDSRWHTDCHSEDDCTADNCLRENLDEILIWLSGEFNIPEQFETGEEDESEEDKSGLFENGSWWGEEDWPGTHSHIWGGAQ